MDQKLGFVITMAVVVAVACVGFSEAETYNVGGDQGWKVGVNYAKWSSSKKFYIGDEIVFKYNKKNENVVQVSLEDYRSCNASKPIKTFQTGADTIKLILRSHFFFVGGFSGHCKAGQKVDIRIVGPRPTPPPSASPSPSPPPSFPPSEHESGPAKPPSTGSSSSLLQQGWWPVAMAAVAAAVVSYVI